MAAGEEPPSLSDPNYLIAFLAAVLAGLAFFVAVLQALLQYVTSSNARVKCSRSAIGSANKLVEKSWSFLSWKWRYRYPILDWTSTKLLLSMAKSETGEAYALNQFTPDKDKFSWRSFHREDELNSWWHVFHETSVVVITKTEQVANIGDLTWRGALKYLWYRARHPYKRLEAPRASWAQVLLALGIRDVRKLMIHLADADTVPSSLDIPLQRVKLRELGSIAFILGFERVTIDVPNRVFRAYSPHGSITTEEVQVLGKVIRFEGDMWKLYNLHGRCSQAWIIRSAGMMIGKLDFGKYVANGLFCNISVLSRVIPENSSCGRYDELISQAYQSRYSQFYRSGPILLEACDLRDAYLAALQRRAGTHSSTGTAVSPCGGLHRTCFAREDYAPKQGIGSSPGLEQLILTDCNILPKKDLLSCFASWQATTGSTVPTLLAAACFNSLHGIAMAFPVRALLVNILPWVRHLVEGINSKERRPFVVSNQLSEAIAIGQIKFARENSKFLLCLSMFGSFNGIGGWGITDMRDLFKALPEQVQEEIVPKGKRGTAHAVLCQEAYELLKEFNPQRWGNQMVEASFVESRGIRALNVLWIQVVVLDMAIQFSISECWDFEPIKKVDVSKILEESLQHLKQTDTVTGEVDTIWHYETWGKRESVVVPSIVKSWRPHDPEIDYMINIERKKTKDTKVRVAPGSKSPNKRATRIAVEENSGTESESDGDSSTSSHDEALSSGDDEDEAEDEADEEEGTCSAPGGKTPTKDDLGVETDSTDGAPAFVPWYLAHHLRENKDMFPLVHGTVQRRKKCERLAELLQLRAIFMIAFLALHPDSSDVYVTEGEDIEMPMA